MSGDQSSKERSAKSGLDLMVMCEYNVFYMTVPKVDLSC